MKPLFIHFINRVANPLLKLKTEEDVERFLDVTQEFREETEFYKNRYEEFGSYYHRMGKHTRIVAFISEPKEFKVEHKLVKEIA